MRLTFGLLQIVAGLALLCAGPVIIDAFIVPELPDSMVDLTAYHGMVGGQVQWLTDRKPTQAAQWSMHVTWVVLTITLLVLGIATLLSGPIADAIREENAR